MIFVKSILFVAAIVIIAGCIGQASTVSAVATGDTVSVYYRLSVNGTEIQSNYGQQPFSFTVGLGQVIPGFDKAVLGMAVGQEKTFTVSPEEGYGTSGSNPLAGKTLVFTVKIASITPATK
jgi:FKBP-type peptidyl-prolyl cis-trans isomerase 2